jgi:tRNA(fMet)-specific endonuclease VapC
VEMVLLDTNIVSYVYKKHELAVAYRPMMVGRSVAISFQTMAELKEGALRAGWSLFRLTHLESFLKRFAVIHSDDDICDHWSKLRATRKQQPISNADAWIAATAVAFNLDLITHNPVDFQGIPKLRIRSLHR